MTDENPRFTREEPGEELDRDPAATFLTQPGGFGGAFADFVLYGVFNGAFERGPAAPSSNITPYGGAGSNFLPNWRFVQASNANITLSHVRDTASPSGSNARFAIATGAAADEAYIEQIVPIGGSRNRTTGNMVRANVYYVGPAAGPYLSVRGQYLTITGAVTGGEDTLQQQLTSTGTSSYVVNRMGNGGSPPANAAFLRIRIACSRGLMLTSNTATIDVTDVRNDKAAGALLLGELTSPASAEAGYITQSNAGRFNLAPGGIVAMRLSKELTAELLGAVVISNIILPVLAAGANDYAPAGITTAAIMTVDCSGASRTITGLSATGWVEGQALWIGVSNAGAGTLTLANASASSASGNRFSCPAGANYAISQGGAVMVVYQPTVSAANPFRVYGKA